MYYCVVYVVTHAGLSFIHLVLSTVMFAIQNLIAHTDTEHIPEVLFHLLLHETSHALGFSQSQFRK